MTTVTPNDKAASKVIAKARTWVDRRKAVQCAPEDQKARMVGKLKQAGNELAEAVEKCRKTGEAEHG